MTTIQVTKNQFEMVKHYCTTNYGPVRYYLHTKIGGVQWNCQRTPNGWEFTVPDSDNITFLLLKISAL